MTDSELQVQRERGGKRERLVASAIGLLHQQGVENTTLAEIAQSADVPPGNVYYYFKTKDELVGAAIDAHAQAAAAMLTSLERHRTPKARLKALARALTEPRDLAFAVIAAYQGISLLTNTFRDPELMARESRRLERWIDSLG